MCAACYGNHAKVESESRTRRLIECSEYASGRYDSCVAHDTESTYVLTMTITVAPTLTLALKVTIAMVITTAKSLLSPSPILHHGILLCGLLTAVVWNMVARECVMPRGGLKFIY